MSHYRETVDASMSGASEDLGERPASGQRAPTCSLLLTISTTVGRGPT